MIKKFRTQTNGKTGLDKTGLASVCSQFEQIESYKPFNHDNTWLKPSLGGNGWGGVGN